jgi:hypothetical protein
MEVLLWGSASGPEHYARTKMALMSPFSTCVVVYREKIQRTT